MPKTSLFLALAGVLLLSVPTTAHRAQASDATTDGLRLVAKWKPDGLSPGMLENLRLVADPVGRRLFTVGSDSQKSIAVYNLDTLERIGSVFTPPTYFPTMPYFDTKLDALIVGKSPDGIRGAQELAAIGVRDGVLKEIGQTGLALNLHPGASVQGIARAPRSDWLYVLTSVKIAAKNAPGTLQLHQVPVSAFNGSNAAIGITSMALRGCAIPVSSSLPSAMAFVAKERSVMFGCSAPSGVFADVNLPTPTGVGRVTFDVDPTAGTPNLNSPDTTFTIYTRDGTPDDALADPGSGRLLVKGASTRAEIQLFDGPTTSWLGSTSFTAGLSIIQMGINPVTGRFYAMNGGGGHGLTVAEARLPAADAGRFYPSFPEVQDARNGPIAVDPLTNHVFFPYSDHVAIVTDDNPPIVAASEGNPDANTLDVPEQSGKTAASYSGAAQGYGARIREVGGLENLLVNETTQGGVGACEVPNPAEPPPPPAPGGAPDACRTRELRMAYVDHADVSSDGGATAAAIGGERDPRSRQAETDLMPDRQEAWPYKEVHCIDTSGRPTEDENGTAFHGAEMQGDVRSSANTARVTCDFAKANVLASVEAGPLSSQGVTVNRSISRAKAIRDAAGMHVTVESVAEGVSVVGQDGKEVLHIGSVSRTADAVAHGRPGTAKTEHPAPVIRNVVVNGTTVCPSDCDPRKVQDSINTLLPGILRVSFPEPDDDDAKGSPGGYQSAVRRKPSEHIEDRVLNEQPDDRIEVPAMVLGLYADNARPWRTIVELAAVEVEARYGIYLLDNSDDISAGSLEDAGGDSTTFADTLLVHDDIVPPVSIDAPLDTASHQSGRLGSFVRQLVRILKNPLRLLLNGDPGAMALVWTMLLLPVYLSARRWLLLRRAALFEELA